MRSTTASRAVRAEWTKQRTVAGPGALLLGAVVVTVGLSAVVSAASTCRGGTGGCPADLTELSLTGVQLGQAVVAVLGVLVIGQEYGTGMIQTTLTAIPRRPAMLAAKAAVLAAAVLVAGALAVLGGLIAGRIILPGNGFTPAHGYPPLSLEHGPTLRAAAGSVLYLALIALFSLGIATAVRDSASAVGVSLGLLYLFPLVAAAVSDPRWQRHLEQIAPMSAGLDIQATTGLRDLPLSPWLGLAVLAGWAGGALLIGGLSLRWRDA